MATTHNSGEAFAKFMEGIHAWALRTAYARDSRNWVETVVLQVGLLDALLRIGIILKRQLKAGNSDIELKLIYQGEDSGYYGERQIYNMARDESVIDEQFHKTLNTAYDQRNRSIHRLLLSEITFGDLHRVSSLYESLIQECSNDIFKLEEEQIRTGRGMTRRGKAPDLADEGMWKGVERRLGIHPRPTGDFGTSGGFIIPNIEGWTLCKEQDQIQLVREKGAITITAHRLADPAGRADARSECERLARFVAPSKHESAFKLKPVSRLPEGTAIEGDAKRAWAHLVDAKGNQWIAMAVAEGPRFLRVSFNTDVDDLEALSAAKRLLQSISLA